MAELPSTAKAVIIGGGINGLWQVNHYRAVVIHQHVKFG